MAPGRAAAQVDLKPGPPAGRVRKVTKPPVAKEPPVAPHESGTTGIERKRKVEEEDDVKLVDCIYHAKHKKLKIDVASDASEKEKTAAKEIMRILDSLRDENLKGSQITDKGFRGFPNKLNFCYSNGLLQLLFLAPKILTGFQKLAIHEFHLDVASKAVTKAIQAVSREIQRGTGRDLEAAVMMFHTALDEHYGFLKSKQHDSCELFTKLYFDLIFCGVFECCEQRLAPYCEKCKKFDKFKISVSCLSILQPTNNASISQMMSEFMDNSNINCSCGEQTRQVYVNKPDFLYLQINRVAPKKAKCTNPIDISREIEVELFCQDSKRIVRNEYGIVGILRHRGDEKQGHYFCNLKNANQEWFRVSDNMIEPRTEMTLRQKARSEVCLAVYKLEGTKEAPLEDNDDSRV
ncbi:uncharacterized protein LOC132200937 [Neocloeon triangulifer]|uniref:uncharacterized protein LOC132200937 n=1 Tax=Neocloeon triangulifer TaxID=2078957 RepID=UPI00286F9B1E|nr:uncharacterized protein LOC132200937 [Neocloeon triangulifer]